MMMLTFFSSMRSSLVEESQSLTSCRSRFFTMFCKEKILAAVV